MRYSEEEGYAELQKAVDMAANYPRRRGVEPAT